MESGGVRYRDEETIRRKHLKEEDGRVPTENTPWLDIKDPRSGNMTFEEYATHG